MPIYEYKCTDKKCGHQFEKLQSMKSPNLTLCPKCKKLAKRTVSRFGGTTVYTK